MPSAPARRRLNIGAEHLGHLARRSLRLVEELETDLVGPLTQHRLGPQDRCVQDAHRLTVDEAPFGDLVEQRSGGFVIASAHEEPGQLGLGETSCRVTRGSEHPDGISQQGLGFIEPALVDEELGHVGRRNRGLHVVAVAQLGVPAPSVGLHRIVPAALEVGVGADVVGHQCHTAHVAELLEDGERFRIVSRAIGVTHHAMGPIQEIQCQRQGFEVLDGTGVDLRLFGQGQSVGRSLLRAPDGAALDGQPGPGPGTRRG